MMLTSAQGHRALAQHIGRLALPAAAGRAAKPEPFARLGELPVSLRAASEPGLARPTPHDSSIKPVRTNLKKEAAFSFCPFAPVESILVAKARGVGVAGTSIG